MDVDTFRPLADWDEDYLLNDIAPFDETVWLEKKASSKFSLNARGKPDGETKEELAKQVSAFSNSGPGFLVFGIDDTTRSIDEGVPMHVGRQPVKDWVEAIIPELLFPPLNQCEARSFVLPAHGTSRGILVVSIPLSEGRPHWCVGTSEIAFIRAGAHSLPMRPQTLLDISSRGSASQAEIIGLNGSGSFSVPSGDRAFHIQPLVRLLNGPVCPLWSFELKIRSGEAWIQLPEGAPKAQIDRGGHLYLVPDTPLFPGRHTPVYPKPFILGHRQSGPLEVEASLYAGSAQPVRRVFSARDLE